MAIAGVFIALIAIKLIVIIGKLNFKTEMRVINCFKRSTCLTFVILLTAISVQAQSPKIIGKWQSDRELTMAFAKDHGKLPDKTSIFLSQLMGHLTLTFTKSAVVSAMPNLESTTAEGAKSELVGFIEKTRYKTLATTETQVATLSLEPITGIKKITLYNFVDENTMWVYLGDRSFPDLNIREYFRRVK